ncbi:Putative fatty acyl-CoA reductase CG5065 [Eumeta japonica]|uniref:Fatty acyl-CoA reductase n=1 Tax=Eumeta variegata TaxID=151549 RepID=A0A4C1WE08_EUMVA|nr:Putative fatty acyl-CoA reductase CG5065 [Eumeta japonica]
MDGQAKYLKISRMAENLDLSLPDRIADTFSGKSIFLTGGTGFIGKVLMEKLLRRCPDISKIYMLIRPKKGKSSKQRLLEIFNHDLFQQLRDIYTLDELASKVIMIDGDIASEGLNLSQESKDLCTKAEIIIHSAACIRFDADLKESIILNTRGTKYVLELAKEFKGLELFGYMSTAYCHPEEAVLEEKGYRPYYDPHEMIRTVEISDEETLSALTPNDTNNLRPSSRMDGQSKRTCGPSNSEYREERKRQALNREEKKYSERRKYVQLLRNSHGISPTRPKFHSSTPRFQRPRYLSIQIHCSTYYTYDLTLILGHRGSST